MTLGVTYLNIQTQTYKTFLPLLSCREAPPLINPFKEYLEALPKVDEEEAHLRFVLEGKKCGDMLFFGVVNALTTLVSHQKYIIRIRIDVFYNFVHFVPSGTFTYFFSLFSRWTGWASSWPTYLLSGQGRTAFCPTKNISYELESMFF